MSAKEALARKKLRARWGAAPAGVDRDAVLEAVFAAICARQPTRPGASQDEYVDLREITATDAGLQIQLTYTFDWDYASASDQTEAHDATLVIGPAGATISRWD